ncbi:histidine kinase [Oscillospiraceae bacterium HV4-5-C5C]|nr:histidine kinase [Oscillospiraceae bacterium HV4-5-C5C]
MRLTRSERKPGRKPWRRHLKLLTRRRGRREHSIRGKILFFSWQALLPVFLLAVYAIFSMGTVYQKYDHIVRNITSANTYNVNLKKNLDESMYLIVIGSLRWSDLKDTDDPENPYVTLAAAETDFRAMLAAAEDPEIRNTLKAILKLSDILHKRIDDIISNVEAGGHYDDNVEMLDMNINILTKLIQDDIADYIYQEASSMELVRQAVSRQASRTTVMLAALLVFMFIGSVISSNTFSSIITDPIQQLCTLSARFAEGDFSVRIKLNSHDELEKLGDSFNQMVGEIASLVEDIRREQNNLKEIELKLLQEQINPHFLYNTLDAISWLTESGEKDQAVSMIASLSNFFRTALSKGRSRIRVEEEISHIRSYLEIQQFRYKDILSYRIEVADVVLPCLMLKLTLQPVVENALYHGIKHKREKGCIVLLGDLTEQGQLRFVVSDNGIGMTPSELKHARALLTGETVDPSQHGFGLNNLQQRIQMTYGPAFGVAIDSHYGQGTTVTLTLPAESDSSRQCLPAAAPSDQLNLKT